MLKIDYIITLDILNNIQEILLKGVYYV